MNKTLFLIFVCMLGFGCMNATDTGQQIFRGNVRTLAVSNPDIFMSPPVIRFGSRDKLNVNFDIISDQHEYLRYKLIHCNADWQPSRLMESEYIDGFNDVEISDYAYSSNTYIHYVNYNISFPNTELPILYSGNYLLQVYPEYEPDDIILQARFSVSEERARINGWLTTKTDRGVDNEYQQLSLSVNTSSFPEINPYQDLIITVTQNNNPLSTSFLTHPLRVEGSNVVFQHSPELIFEAGNEYRRFETVRTDYPGMHVEHVEFDGGIWHAQLVTDESRHDKAYTYDKTQHGRFKIDEYNSTDPDLSADYIMVDFTLELSHTPQGKIYVDGDFTNHRFENEYLMKYNFTTGRYQTTIPLKQGSYNYRYVVVPEKPGNPSSKFIEGNKYETNNEYLVNVYLRTPGIRGDRLIGSYVIE